MKRWFGVAVATLLAAPVAAQQDINTICSQFSGSASVYNRCTAVAQAVDAAQPQLGILLAGGNPTLGTASTSGVRMGLIPRVGAGLRINVVAARFPDIRDVEGSGESVTTDEFAVPAPAIGANVSLGLTQGFSLAPTMGGVGSIELLGSATLIPLELAGDEFGENVISWGAGARVGLLRESFVTPGISVSLMYRDMGTARFGEVCDGTETPVVGTSPARSVCSGGGDFGEIEFGLSNWSARGAISKRLLGLGLTAGVGYDKFETDADVAFRAPAPPLGQEQVYRFTDVAVDNDRWSAFIDGSFTFLVASLVAEVGWMQGSDPITGFPSASDFDPNEGTFFGSLGVRIGL